MNFIPSINIELNTAADFQYIITENAKMVAGRIIDGYNSGHHSFTLIGTYGTGKSSFILAMEDDLMSGANRLIKQNVLDATSGFEFLNIVGDYNSLNSLLANKLGSHDGNAIDALNQYYQSARKHNKFLFIVVDEFGKVLEHAANHNPEKELYFLQKLSEFVNVPSRKIIFLVTLHQNFGSYARSLSEIQRNEWNKVKGRFQEIVFAEPVEQLLYLTAKQLSGQGCNSLSDNGFKPLYDLGKRSKIISNSFSLQTAERLSPLDPISAVCLTLAIQRYGQNERSLFSFLTARGIDSPCEFKMSESLTYNVAKVYDYLTYHFYSGINEMNADSTGWRSLFVAIERIEGSNHETVLIDECLKIIKTIGLINMFFNGIVLDDDFLLTYGENALGIKNVDVVVKTLLSEKIIRFATYKSQYILFEGTNLNIESELFKAASIVPTPQLTVEEISPYINQKVAVATASYYRTGTPRYFEYHVSNEIVIELPSGDIDGFVQLIFPLCEFEEEVKKASGVSGATIFCYFRNTKMITRHLHEIKKLQYVIDNVAIDDRIAKVELEKQKAYETNRLNDVINNSLKNDDNSVVWYYKGASIEIRSVRDFNKFLSYVCDDVYNQAPVIRNELFNRHKLSSAISLARINLLDAMLANADREAFGIDGFPPEKTIYYTLFRESGIHRINDGGQWILGAPTKSGLKSIWNASIDFINSTVDKPRKLADLSVILKSAPYKLKQGVIDFWIPIFLFINQQDFALYNGDRFVLNVNKEIFELIQKRINDFTIKAFKIAGVKLEFFRRYRQFLHKDDGVEVTSESLVETVRPFFHFYRCLNSYAKRTRKFDSAYTAKFRDVLSDAQDPTKTFFEDLPAVFGYKNLNSEEFIAQYIGLIKNAIRELNMCYDNLINRIEEKIITHLGIPNDYEEYKDVLKSRYESIDSRILTPKTRAVLNRVISPSESKREFIEKLSIVVTDKRLDQTTDNEEPLLIHQLLHIFSELERHSAISDGGNHGDDAEAYNFELASNSGKFSKSQTYRLPKSKSKVAEEIANKISKLLPDDEELDICVLLKLLNDRVK